MIKLRDYLFEKDYDKIMELIHQENWQSFYVERKEEFVEALKSSSSFVIYEDDKLVGFIRCLTDGVFTLFIAEIIIDTRYRRKGYGRKLIEFVHNQYPKTRIDLLSDNDDFYKALGFRFLGNGMRKCDWY